MRKSIFKRTLGMILAAGLMVSSMTACGGSQTATETSDSNSNSYSSSSATSEKSDAAESAGDSYAYETTEAYIDSYEEAASIIDKKISEDDKLPSFAEIIDSITTQEQLEQMKSMLLNEFSKRQSKSVRGK